MMTASAVLLCACSLAVDSNRVQCSTDTDCEMRGAAFVGSTCVESVCQAPPPPPEWACLDEDAPPLPTGGPFQAPFLVRHMVSQMPFQGVKAKLCRKIDVACATPLSEDLLTNATGQVTFPVTAAFAGYAQFEGAEIINGLYFFNPPVAADLPEAAIAIGSAKVVGLLAMQTGATQLAERGIILIQARDCTGKPAAGVTFSASGSDSSSKIFYSKEGLPSGDAVQTDDAGYGGLVNAEVGSIIFTATVVATGRRLGQVTLLSREGAITYGSVVPHGG
jgi:hypothetical protein